jgi:hypothetical protein
MRHIPQTIVLIALAGSFFLTGCTKDFVSTNSDPATIPNTSAAQLFNRVLSSLPVAYYEQMFIYNDLCSGYSQLTTVPNQGSLTLGNVREGVATLWPKYYSTLANIRNLQSMLSGIADQDLARNEWAMLKVINAYLCFRMTDLWGDIPYSQAGYAYGVGGKINTKPGYDSQETIYRSLLADLKWANDSSTSASSDGQGNAYLNYSQYETLFGNDMTKWVKFANALRLRYALRMSAKDPQDAMAVIQDVLGNNEPLPQAGEDMGLFPNALGTSNWNASVDDGIFDAFVNDLSGTGLRMGTTIWNTMNGNSDSVADPRIPIFFFPNDSSLYVACPQQGATEQGNPYGQPTNLSKRGNFSSVNLFLTNRSSTDQIPQLFITAAEVDFLLAEIYARPDLGMQNLAKAQTYYQLGIQTSINFWYSVPVNDPGWVPQPVAPNTAQVDSFLNSAPVQWNAANALSLIYTQEWIDGFWEPWEDYALTRRTGNLTPGGALPSSSPLYQFYRLPYDVSEANYNTTNYNAEIQLLGGADNTSAKVWWMP